MRKSVKVELYRMIKSNYSWIIVALANLMILGSVFMTCSDYNYYLATPEAFKNLKTTFQQVNWGIYLGSVLPEWCEEHAIPITELFMRNIQSKILLMFQTVFVIMFVGEELKSRYLLNIYTSYPKKRFIIQGKFVSVCLFTILLFFTSFLSTIIFFYAINGYVLFENTSIFLRYMIAEYLLYVSYSMVIIMLTYIIKNSAVCLLIGILEAAGIMQIIDVFVHSVLPGCESFTIMNKLVSGIIVLLSIDSGIREFVWGIILAILYGGLAMLVTTIILKRRDIH